MNQDGKRLVACVPACVVELTDGGSWPTHMVVRTALRSISEKMLDKGVRRQVQTPASHVFGSPTSGMSCSEICLEQTTVSYATSLLTCNPQTPSFCYRLTASRPTSPSLCLFDIHRLRSN